MANILDPLQKAIAKGFKGKLLSGTIARATASGVNEFGDPVTGPDQTYACEGMVADYDDAYRKAAGIPETSVKILLIAGNTAVVPKKVDRVTFRGVTYEILKIKADPALATYDCEAYRVS